MDRDFEYLGCWLIGICCFVLIVFGVGLFGQRVQACEEKGGILVKTSGGYECVKNLERVRP